MIPKFSTVDFFSFYVEIPIMIFMYIVWVIVNRLPALKRILEDPIDEPGPSGASPVDARSPKRVRWFDLVDTSRVNLYADEHNDELIDQIEDQEREQRLKSRWRWLWRVYYLVA